MPTARDAIAPRTPRRAASALAAAAVIALSASVPAVSVLAAPAVAGPTVAPAATGTVTYIVGHNVFVAAQDGSNPRQVTSDGTAASPYYSPTESDDGHIVAGRGELIYRMDQWGHVLNTIDPPDLRSGGGATHGGAPADLAVSPDGTKIAYSYVAHYCSGGGYCRDWPVTGVTAASGLTDPAVYGTTFGAHPSWVTNSRIAADKTTEYGNIYLFDLGRGTVGSADHWFDDTNLRVSGHRKLTDPQIARSSPYATLVRGEYDQAEILLLDLSSVGNYATGIPARTMVQVCDTWEELGFAAPTLSPDGAVLAWEAADGVLTVPTNGGSCGSADVTIPGAWSPAFSPAPLQTTRPTYPPPGGETAPPPPATDGPAQPTQPTQPTTVDMQALGLAAKPSVTGTARVGKKVRAGAIRFVPAATTVRYQWLRDRRPIKGATAATYRISRHDRRHRLTVRVTGSRVGYENAVAVSRPVRVRR